MKIKIKEQIEREIEITFPSFYKSTESFIRVGYYALFSKNLGLFVTDGFTYQVTLNNIDFKEIVPCEKSEVEKVFKANQKFFATTMENITVDLDSNNPTEILEQL